MWVQLWCDGSLALSKPDARWGRLHMQEGNTGSTAGVLEETTWPPDLGLT